VILSLSSVVNAPPPIHWIHRFPFDSRDRQAGLETPRKDRQLLGRLSVNQRKTLGPFLVFYSSIHSSLWVGLGMRLGTDSLTY
jgi:hypothetical protein